MGVPSHCTPTSDKRPVTQCNFLQRFEKFKALTLYMPPWCWSEIAAALVVFPEIDTVKAKELYSMYGGIVQAVLGSALSPGSETALEVALSDASPERLLQQVGRAARRVSATMLCKAVDCFHCIVMK